MGNPRRDVALPKHRPRAFAWARVSTEKQHERGLSIPQQFQEIRDYADLQGIEIVGEYEEAASAFRHQEKRHEFQKMLDRARAERDVSIVIVHDLSRFCRDSRVAKNLIEDLRKAGVQVLSVTDPVIDRETSAGVYMEAITFAKNEAYSREVAFHTRKGCRANVQRRDPETGWCYKNGGQPPFGYRAEQLQRGGGKHGGPLIKSIWVLDESIVAGRPMFEWTRHCLLELAAKGASLDTLRDFCNNTGIPGRRKPHWGTSTWYALLQPHSLLQFCGHGVWNVHTKEGRERPREEWVTVENAHPALITEQEAAEIWEERRASGKKQFNAVPSRSRASAFLLSGGVFVCARCGANMMGFRNGHSTYYVCGSQPYRKGFGCGPGVYVPQEQVESEVFSGLQSILSTCVDPQGFTCKVNKELRRIWQESTGLAPDLNVRIEGINKKIENIRLAVEDGLNDASWANDRLRMLLAERQALATTSKNAGSPPQLDAKTVMEYRRQVDKLFRKNPSPIRDDLDDAAKKQQGREQAERKHLLRMMVQEVKLLPLEREVSITYRLPEAVMNGLVAGEGFEPSTFGL